MRKGKSVLALLYGAKSAVYALYGSPAVGTRMGL
jgi:hypothetical protein